MSDLTPPAKRIERPLRDLAAWVAHFRSATIPVLDSTAEAVRELAVNEDAVDAHLLSEAVGADPLMTLKLLAYVGSNSRRETDVETVVLLSIGPFFRHFGELPTLSQALQDTDDAVIHEAALLHGFAELLLWCHAPSLALEIARRQQADPALRSVVAQTAVLGINLADLQQALMKAWRLPELLIRLGDAKHAHNSQVKNVTLAVRLARHTAQGWANAALPDDVAEIAALLLLGTEPTPKLLHQIDS